MLFVTYKIFPLNSTLIVYNANHWRWKTVANLANQSHFAKILPVKAFVLQSK